MTTLPSHTHQAYSTPSLTHSSSSLNVHPDTILHEDSKHALQTPSKDDLSHTDKAAKHTYPPLFVGINLPGERPGVEYSYTDEALVERSLLEEYDMITSRISTPAYRERVEALFAETEGNLMRETQQQQPPQPKTSMPPPSPRPLQTRPLRNENTKRSPSLDGAASFQSLNSGNSGIDRASPAPSLFSTSNKFSNPPNGTSLASPRPTTEPAYGLPFNSFDVPPLELDDILLLPGPHIRNVIALTAPWVELDSKNPRIAALSAQVLLREISYATYCGVTYFIVCGPKRRTNIEQYSQAISRLLAALPPYCHLLVHLPFAEEDYISSRTGDRVPPADYLSIWDVWNTIRTINNYAPNLAVVLQVPPKCTFPPVVASRWYAEPVKMLMISSATFVSNARGYPVLPKVTQSLLFKFFSKNPFLIISDVYDRSFEGGSNSYLLYARHLVKMRPKPTAIEAYSEGYNDLLQLPLQPLADNLESSTYEVFERDPVKYAQYEQAIYKALQDIHKSYIYVAVVGAGRGPLVERVLIAASNLGKNVHVFAIEKNESACIHLSRRLQYEWVGRNVEIVRTDMRKWRPHGIRLSIIVSELLGSFGDNELSPECLDGLDTNALLDTDGIMIPQCYTAYFTPSMSPTLYTSASNFKPSTTPGNASGVTASSLTAAPPSGIKPTLQTPYVVMLSSVDMLAPGQFGKAWTFSHPSYSPVHGNLHNTRKTKHTFTVGSQGIMHGIAGYFESTLYRDVQLSTRPDTIDSKSKDMLSWFPMWFPLTTPLYVTEGSEVDVSMWRLTDSRRVWYEWSVETYVKAAPSGSSSHSRRRIRTGVSELHNSNGRYFAMTL